MEILNVNGDVLELKEYSVDKLVETVSVHSRSENTQWIMDLLTDALNGQVPAREDRDRDRCRYLLWERNKKVVGFSYLHQEGEKKAAIYFKVFEEEVLASQSLQDLLEASIEKSFSLYNLEQIYFNCKKDCSSVISATFLEKFNPHPIGWVHLSDHKFVLTRAQFEKKEEEFYKM